MDIKDATCFFNQGFYFPCVILPSFEMLLQSYYSTHFQGGDIPTFFYDSIKNTESAKSKNVDKQKNTSSGSDMNIEYKTENQIHRNA